MKKAIKILTVSVLLFSLQSCIVCKYRPEPEENNRTETLDNSPTIDVPN